MRIIKTWCLKNKVITSVKDLKGKLVNIQNLSNDDNPIVISFWATWCKPCKKELNTISEVYEDWQEETQQPNDNDEAEQAEFYERINEMGIDWDEEE